MDRHEVEETPHHVDPDHLLEEDHHARRHRGAEGDGSEEQCVADMVMSPASTYSCAFTCEDGYELGVDSGDDGVGMVYCWDDGEDPTFNNGAEDAVDEQCVGK